MKIASSTYYAALTRLKSAREIRNEELTRVIQRVYDENYKVYGARKMWCELHREGIGVGRCRAERLMRNMGLVRNNGSVRRGPRGEPIRITVSDKDDSWAPELVKRQFTAEAQNRLRVADFTYVSTWAGTAYTAFGIDVFFRRIVRSTCSLSKEKDLVLDAIEMGLKERAVLLEGGARTSSFTILTRAISTTSFRFTRTVLRGCGAAMGRT